MTDSLQKPPRAWARWLAALADGEAEERGQSAPDDPFGPLAVVLADSEFGAALASDLLKGVLLLLQDWTASPLRVRDAETLLDGLASHADRTLRWSVPVGLETLLQSVAEADAHGLRRSALRVLQVLDLGDSEWWKAGARGRRSPLQSLEVLASRGEEAIGPWLEGIRRWVREEATDRMPLLGLTLSALGGRVPLSSTRVLAAYFGLSQPEEARGVEFYMKEPSAGEGEITFAESVRYLHHSVDLLRAWARSVGSPAAAFGSLASAFGRRLEASSRLALATGGSLRFVVDIDEPPLVAQDGGDVTASYGEDLRRGGLDGLETTLNALAEAAQEAQGPVGPNAFHGRVEFGVSANACEILASMLSVGRLGRIEVRVLRGEAESRHEMRPAPVVFRPAMRTALMEGAAALRGEGVEVDVTLEGPVNLLRREDSASYESIGIRAEVDGKRRWVLALVDDEEAKQASSAYAGKRWVRCRGDLHRKGRQYRLVNLKGFEVVEPPLEQEGPDRPEPAIGGLIGVQFPLARYFRSSSKDLAGRGLETAA